jgi:imidazolonepropionase-like amidohydrolase
LEQRIETAMVHRDAAYLDSVYAPTFRFKHATGDIETRAQRLASLRAPKAPDAPGRTLSREVDSLDVEVHGNVALTTGRIHVVRNGGDPHLQNYTIRYARIYARSSAESSWKLVTHHSTSDAQQGAPPPFAATNPLHCDEVNATDAFAITHVTVIDVAQGRRLRHHTVIVEGNRIARVGPSETTHVPPGVMSVDADGAFLIPGLWDMHTLALNGVAGGEATLALNIAYGITGIRDVGTRLPPATVAQLRSDIAAGRIVGPRIVYAGRAIYHRGVRRGFSAPTHFAVETPDDARKAVDSLSDSGVDYVKVYWLPREVLAAVIDQAKRRGLRVTGQVATGWKEASDAGIYGLEHITEMYRGTSLHRADFVDYAFQRGRWASWSGRVVPPLVEDSLFEMLRATPDKAYYRETLRTLVRNGTWVTTALANTTYSRQYRELPDAQRRRFRSKAQQDSLESDLKEYAFHLGAHESLLGIMRDLHSAGVRLLAGSISGALSRSTPGAALHDELHWLQKAGLTPAEALRSATLNPARFFNATDSLGTIAQGKLADLVLLDADPLRNIDNAMRVRAVVANGRLFDRTALDRLIIQSARGGR